jgi:hypothetical protein
MASKELSSEKPYKCEYCNTGFVRERTLMSHTCEKKRRALQKSDKHVQMGFMAFNQFYLLSAGARKNKTYEEFCASQYYNAFVKFGSFVTNVKPLYPEKYINHVVTSGVKLDQWCKEAMYEKYATELIRKEGVETALERSINTMVEWAEENNSVWNHYFLYASPNRVIWHIRDGKVSPWLILNCKSGKQMLGKFNDEQLSMVYHVMDPGHWAVRFKRQASDVQLVKDVVKQSKL